MVRSREFIKRRMTGHLHHLQHSANIRTGRKKVVPGFRAPLRKRVPLRISLSCVRHRFGALTNIPTLPTLTRMDLADLRGLLVHSSNWFGIISVQLSSLGTSLSAKFVQFSSGQTCIPVNSTELIDLNRFILPQI